MDNLLLPSLHATKEPETPERVEEFVLVDDRDFPHEGFSIQFSRFDTNRGTVKNGSCAFGSQRLCAFAI